MSNLGRKDTAKRTARGKTPYCTILKRKDGSTVIRFAIKKSEIIFQLFLGGVSEYPISGVFVVLCPGGTEGFERRTTEE